MRAYVCLFFYVEELPRYVYTLQLLTHPSTHNHLFTHSLIHPLTHSLTDHFSPLLAFLDPYNRSVGWAAAIFSRGNVSKAPDSRWLLFGIANASFYTSPAFTSALAPLIRTLVATLPLAPSPSLSPRGVLSRLWADGEPAPLPPLYLSPVTSGARHFMYTDPATGTPRRWFMFGANMYRTFNFADTLDKSTIALRFESLHQAGCNCVRAFAWEQLLETPGLMGVAVAAARKWGIR